MCEKTAPGYDTDMQKYRYIYLGNGISKEAEKEYNRLCRYEQYQQERDLANGLMYYQDEKFPIQIVDETTTPQFEEQVRIDLLRRKRLAILPYAVEWLKEESPEEYTLIYEYYLSGQKIGLKRLSKKYGVTHQMISRRISTAREKLKAFIILHEKCI